ncbi:ribonuclease D [Candidatus Pelagibacter sp.]|jgi:ribonuclease D|nr:ribonuclease D [Candidatus Pelagibacter sp.]MDC0363977.1 ribonuclease D [Candidatus Pelagibacter sp.]MDC0427283.1 ribonuclease D [Candidatus Pelagibacter sp.]|tara:strand:+ start:358 stop:969 length:612 start_codon:yes stop_codon:yes gene_type:complete
MNIDIKLHKDDLPEDLDLGNIIAVDGEFMGLNVKRDPLCLIQVSSGNSDAHIIQLDRKNYKAPNLSKMLEDKKITKIFHYGRADMAHIKHYLKITTENILDTKIASKLARSYSDSHSLKVLIKEFINIDISKQFQSSDFGGKLTEAQLKYCANDVIYLHRIHEELNKILVRENRIHLYNDCLKFLKTRVDLDLASFNDDIWSH